MYMVQATAQGMFLSISFCSLQSYPKICSNTIFLFNCPIAMAQHETDYGMYDLSQAMNSHREISENSQEYGF